MTPRPFDLGEVRSRVKRAEQRLARELMVRVLGPLARSGRRERAHAAVRAYGWALSRLPGQVPLFGEAFGRAFDLTPAPARQMALEWLLQPLRDYVFTEEQTVNPGRHREWRCSHVNYAPVQALVEAKQSFVLAMTHFARDAASYWILDPEKVPFFVYMIAAPMSVPEGEAPNPADKVRLGSMLACLQAIRPDLLKLVFTESPRELAAAVGHLRTGGPCVLCVMMDAPWDAGRINSFTRPFAGQKQRGFATGAVAIARRTKCPIVLATQVVDGPDTCTVWWHDPVWVPSDADRATEERLTSDLLDEVEQLIGRWPTRYVLHIGGERRWNASLTRWESLPDELSADRAQPLR